mgnify:CR=1 FL=1
MTVKTLDNLVEDFALFDNWEDRYRYLIDLGQRLEPMDSSLKTDENLIKGCTSRVWMTSAITEKEGAKIIRFHADSDAQIVRGLIYILVAAYQNKPVYEISSVDIEAAFENLGLAGHLSPNRRNGFFSMVEYIRTQGAQGVG